jgi:hypothetical protein
LLSVSPRLTRTVLSLALALYFFGAAFLAIFFVESLAFLVVERSGIGHLPRQVQRQQNPIRQSCASAAPARTAGLMIADVNVRLESFPEHACAELGSGRYGPGAHAVLETPQ